MGFNFSLLLASGALVLFAVALVFSTQNYKRRFNAKYSPKNMFPFEYNYEGKFFDNVIGNTALVFASLFLAVFYATFDTSHSNGMATFALISGIFSSVISALLFFVPLKNLKTHVALTTFLFAFSFTLSASLFLLNLLYWNQNHSILNLIGAVYSGALGLWILVLIMNPRLSLRVGGEEVKLENGQTKVVRPKWIMYAFTEWNAILLTFLQALSVIAYLISISQGL